MGYIYRTQSSSLYIDTPIIGIPNEIIYISIISGFSRYNGPYIQLETGSDLFLEMYRKDGYSGQGLPINELRIWRNLLETNCYIHGYLDESGNNFPGGQSLYDYNYYNQRFFGAGYSILFRPYFTYSNVYGGGSLGGADPLDWIWEKNLLLYPADYPPEASGLNAVPGSLPQVQKDKVSVPFRTVLTNNGQNFIVQGNQFALNPTGGLPI